MAAGSYEDEVRNKIATVAALIEAGEHEDGWCHGLRYLMVEAGDELIDFPAWLAGRKHYDVPEKVEARLLRAIECVREAYVEWQLALQELDRD